MNQRKSSTEESHFSFSSTSYYEYGDFISDVLDIRYVSFLVKEPWVLIKTNGNNVRETDFLVYYTE